MVELILDIKTRIDGALTTNAHGNPIIEVLQVHTLAPHCPGVPRQIDTASLLKKLQYWLNKNNTKTWISCPPGPTKATIEINYNLRKLLHDM